MHAHNVTAAAAPTPTPCHATPPPTPCHAMPPLRVVADVLHEQLPPRILTAIERHASQDAKYCDRLRLENYTFLVEGLSHVGGVDAQALQKVVEQARTKRVGGVAYNEGGRTSNMRFNH